MHSRWHETSRVSAKSSPDSMDHLLDSATDQLLKIPRVHRIRSACCPDTIHPLLLPHCQPIAACHPQLHRTHLEILMYLSWRKHHCPAPNPKSHSTSASWILHFQSSSPWLTLEQSCHPHCFSHCPMRNRRIASPCVPGEIIVSSFIRPASITDRPYIVRHGWVQSVTGGRRHCMLSSKRMLQNPKFLWVAGGLDDRRLERSPRRTC